jgi:hypothetical protein
VSHIRLWTPDKNTYVTLGQENRRQELHPLRVERIKTADALDKARVESIQTVNLVKSAQAAPGGSQ